MAKKWTEEQQAAIDSRYGTVLVSAAAGSGKTAVLTQRIIESILDAENPLEITDLLVVTYSKAAAGELKSRIGDAVRGKLAENPSDRRLRRQQFGLERAEISTIHSFCLKLVREGASRLGLPSGLRVAEVTEAAILKRQTMDRLLEEEYRRSSPAFLALTDNFVKTQDDFFADKLLELHTKACAMPEGAGIFRLYAQGLRETNRSTFLSGEFGKLLQREVTFFALHYRDSYRQAMAMMQTDERYFATFEAFAKEYPFLERLVQPFEQFDDLCRYVLDFQTVGRLPPVKSADKTDAFEAAIDMRKKFKADLIALRKNYFGRLLETFDRDTERSASLAEALAELLEKFDRLFASEKIRRGILDFTDLERYAHCLLMENGQPTAYAKEVAGRYRQIYIDEYQDVNRIQDEIFSAIASDNRFMVGDIKQSIYAFRGAEPSIFADYRRQFSESAEAGKLIFLSKNFRCDQPIIDFANAVCRKLFPARCGEVPYEQGDELVHGKESDSPKGCPVQIALLPSGEKEEGDPEAEYVAEEIDRLISQEGYQPKEIAILLRSAKTTAPNYEKALEKRGIRYRNSQPHPFFEEPEVLLALSLLGCIDNPRQDVYLAGALMSPVFGFTLNDLLDHFKVREGQCLYELLCSAENGVSEEAAEIDPVSESKKAESKGVFAPFLNWLSDCRAQSTRLSAEEMVQLVYRSTMLPAIAGADPKRGKEAGKNLNRLYELARSFEQNGFLGLHRFLQFIQDSAESGEVDKNAGAADDNCVQIMTVHQSKGLEFPVCFLSETMKKVNLTDSKEQILFDKQMGLAMSLRDDSGFAHYNTLLRRMLAQKLTDSALEEEMRVLYVGLTRAQARLYVTAKAKEPLKVVEECRQFSRCYSAFAVAKRPDYFHWILGALIDADRCFDLILPDSADEADSRETLPPPLVEDGQPALQFAPAYEGADSGETCESPSDWLRQRLSFTYPAGRLQGLPAKLTVSTLKPDFLDEEEGFELPKMVEKPSFLHNKDNVLQENAENVLTGAERGTATHVFMQFCDFDRVKKDGVDGELIRLTDLGFLSPAMAGAVYKEALEAFFESSLYREMRGAKQLRREFRFNVQLPAAHFTQDADFAADLQGTELLVQGVIDCWFEKSDGSLKLIDYKTDRLGKKPSETAALLYERYQNQLRYYKMALEKLTGRQVSEAVLYSFWQSQAFAYPLK